MAKLKSTLPNMLLSLTLICLATGAILAFANKYTVGPIAASKTAALQAAIREVTPEFDNDPTIEAYKEPTSDGDSLTIYPAKKSGELVGVAVESNTMNGFSGEIRVMVGFDHDGVLTNYSVLEHAETPGLGSKMDVWFKTDKNHQSVIGRSLAKGNLQVAKDGGDVDAITASTITSRAFLNAINRAYSAYKQTDTTTAATVNATTGAIQKEGEK